MYRTHKLFGLAAITELLFLSLILMSRILDKILKIELNIYIILILLALFTKLSLKTVEYMDILTLKTPDNQLNPMMLDRKFKMIYFLLKSYWSETSNKLVTPHRKIFYFINQYISSHYSRCADIKCPCNIANTNGKIYDPNLKTYTHFKQSDVNGEAGFLMNMTYVRKLIIY